MDVSTISPLRLDLGAGDKRFDGWVSVGLEDSHDIQTDLRALPLPDACADEAMAIHVLEHLLPWDVVPTLREWKRVLKPGGKLALELPDFFKCCRNYVQEGGQKPWLSIWGIYGDPNEGKELMLHRYGYTADTLAPLLREAGFIKIKRGNPEFHHRRLNRDFRIEARRPL